MPNPRAMPAAFSVATMRSALFMRQACALFESGTYHARRHAPFRSYALSAIALARVDSLRGPDVPQTQARAHAQYLRLRIRAAGEADRFPRIRRALAARQRDQSDGRAGVGARPRHAHPRTRRKARDRDRPRLPRLFGFGE